MKKKMVTLLMAGVLAMSGFTGYGAEVKAEEAPTLDTSEEVELSMYVISDRPAGQDVVDENINALLKEKLNCTLKINWIPWSDYANKYPLLFSSGEEFDLIYTSAWLNYTSLARRGAFMPLDELWPTYAPKNYEATSDFAKQQTLVDGVSYCIPSQLATYRAYGPIYRTDIMEGTDWDGKMETFEDIEEYCDIVKETQPGMEPLEIYSSGSEWDDVYMFSLGYLPAKGSAGDFFWYNAEEENPKLMTYWEIAETPEFLEMMSRWNEKGFFSKSALSDTDSTKQLNGKAAMRAHNLDTYQGLAIAHPEYKAKYAKFTKYSAHLPFTQDSIAVSNTSKNPERALAAWDLITSDQEMYDAFMYGVKDTSYTLNEDGQFAITDPNLYAVSACWAARSTALNRNQAGTPEDYKLLQESFEEEIAADDTFEKYSAFTINTADVETEYSACQNAHQQYWWPLELGYTEAEAGLEQYKSAMEAAGVEKVREKLQAQLDEYVAAMK